MSEPSSLFSASRRLRIVAIASAAVLLTGVFILRGFPYDRLGMVLAQRLEQSTGIHLRIGHVAPSLGLRGPGITAEDVRARTPDGSVWNFTRLYLRPAWSFSWLRARPAFFVDFDAKFGELEGVATLGTGNGSFAGEARNLDLAELRLESFVQGLQLTGRGDLTADVAFDESGAVGPITLAARAGSLAHPQLPMAVPFDTLEGDLALGGETLLAIHSLKVQSVLGTGSLAGTISRAGPRGSPPLELQIDVSTAENIRGILASQGVRLAADGSLNLTVTGTTARPIVR